MMGATDLLGKMGRFAADQMPWEERQPKPIPIAPADSWVNVYMELLIAGVGILAAVVIFSYYCYGFYLQRVHERHNRIKRKYWTVDKINACLIPLGIAVGFTAHYFMSR